MQRDPTRQQPASTMSQRLRAAANAPTLPPIPLPTHYPQHPANADKREPNNASKASATAPHAKFALCHPRPLCSTAPSPSSPWATSAQREPTRQRPEPNASRAKQAKQSKLSEASRAKQAEQSEPSKASTAAPTYLLGFPPTLFLSTVLRALRGLMHGVENLSVTGLRATSQNILWSVG